jgi:hypothetical protein
MQYRFKLVLRIFDHFADQPDNFARFGMTFGLKFGIDQRSVHTDLEAASIRGNEGERFNQMLKLPEQVLFQAHGPVGVVSNRTVDDFDFKHTHSSIQ